MKFIISQDPYVLSGPQSFNISQKFGSLTLVHFELKYAKVGREVK